MLFFKFISALFALCSVYAINENVGNNYIEIDSFKLNWVISDKAVDFVFKTKVSSRDNVWASFGLSNDRSMVWIYFLLFLKESN